MRKTNRLCIFIALIFVVTNINAKIKPDLDASDWEYLKSFFDSLSIDEIEKQKIIDAQKAANEDESDDDDGSDDKKVKTKTTSITKYFKSWVITGNIGPMWENAGQKQTFYLTPTVEKTYSADNNTNVLAELSLFFGVHKPLFSDISGQIGVVLSTLTNAPISGEIWDDADPRFNNLSYVYTLKATRIAAKGIILLDKNWIVIPWISGSLGISYNYLYNYLDIPKIFEVVVNPKFQPYTSQAITYSFGAGFQKNISKHFQVGVGYEFTDWGSSRLTKSLYQSTYNAINLNHFYTNGFTFNLSYLA